MHSKKLPYQFHPYGPGQCAQRVFTFKSLKRTFTNRILLCMLNASAKQAKPFDAFKMLIGLSETQFLSEAQHFQRSNITMKNFNAF